MIVLLEGPDGAGKTTIAKYLEKEYGFTYHHRGPPKSTLYEEYASPLFEMWQGDHVLDRWHLSELVYGPLLRGKSKISASLFKVIEELLDMLYAQQFIVVPDIAVIQQRMEDRGDDMITPRQIPYIVAEYLRLQKMYPQYEILGVNWKARIDECVNQELKPS